CRMGFCLSLEEPKVPNPNEFAEEDREFNRYTLLGEYDALFMALLRQRMYQDDLDADDLEGYFRAHLNRGISLLQQRVRNVADLATLVPASTHRGPRPRS
ncbi:MAG TPA: DndE family protein, partial [Edaphobacter sp.]|nr:DndE family protein [Edaphobacter sp.]